MKITSPNANGNEITTLCEWGNCVKRGHWKEGRSAYSLADFIIKRKGANVLERRISCVLSQPVKLQKATPEFRASFDSYRGNPSNLDLGIFGRVGSNASLFVGLEAKVDEPFGDNTVCGRYKKAIHGLRCNPRSKAHYRIKDLLSRYFAETCDPCDSIFSKIGYQLLTGTAGTIARNKDVSVFYILVFKTHKYDKLKGQDNQCVYEKFIEVTNGKTLKCSEDFCAHEITIAEKPLICIYHYISLDALR